MTLPNLISLFRILITPFFFTCLIYYDSGKEYYRYLALGLFTIGCLSDALDGFLARISESHTEFGRFLDPLADKLLLLSGFLGLLFVEELAFRPPLWVTITIVFRDLVIVIGLIIVFMMSGKIRVRPNLLGKATTALQMATLFAVLLQWGAVAPWLWYSTAVLTIISGLVYVVRDLKFLQVPK